MMGLKLLYISSSNNWNRLFSNLLYHTASRLNWGLKLAGVRNPAHPAKNASQWARDYCDYHVNKGAQISASYETVGWTHDAIITSLQRQNRFWRSNDVIFALCVRWDHA